MIQVGDKATQHTEVEELVKGSGVVSHHDPRGPRRQLDNIQLLELRHEVRLEVFVLGVAVDEETNLSGLQAAQSTNGSQGQDRLPERSTA